MVLAGDHGCLETIIEKMPCIIYFILTHKLNPRKLPVTRISIVKLTQLYKDDAMKKIWILVLTVFIACIFLSEGRAAYVFEAFEIGQSPEFSFSFGPWSFSDGRMHYSHPFPKEGYLTWVPWNGGKSSGGFAPSLTDTNYFYEFSASVSASYENELKMSFYGLYVCGQIDSNEDRSFIIFMINADGYHVVQELKDGQFGLAAGRTKSSFVTGQDDILTILKQGDLFRFFINYQEVEFLKIDEHLGGSIGLIVDMDARASFDNFEIVDLNNILADYDSNTKALNIPIIDICGTGSNFGEYRASLERNMGEPISFGVKNASQTSDDLYSWYNILTNITPSPYHANFDCTNKALYIPSIRINDNTGGLSLYRADLELRPSTTPPEFDIKDAGLYSPDCSVIDQKTWLYNRMMDVYYWYDEMPAVDPQSYASVEDLLEAIKYSEKDKFSYITSRENYTALFEEGTYIGLGFGIQYDNSNKLRVSHVYKNSPADKAGIQRAYRILEVNGKTVEEIETGALWEDVWGESKIGVRADLKFEDLQSNTVIVSLAKDTVQINTVYYYDILNIGVKKVGYLVFMEFLETSEEELNTVFSVFKQEGIDDLILDLRYNPGGRGDIAKHLGNLIGGIITDGFLFHKFVFNDKHQDQNEESYYEDHENALDLSRIIVITSGSTCSASELVINSLKPFLDVTLIGSKTCGKPFGMIYQPFCEKVLEPIVMEVLNANEEGEYYGGILPDCEAMDDLTNQLGNAAESSLKEALYYLQNQQCSSGVRSRSAPEILSSKEVDIKGLRRVIGAF